MNAVTANGETEDLGFEYEVRKNGEIVVFRFGRPVTVLRGRPAQRLISVSEGAGEAEAQQLLDRLTGNYKRGNERVAGEHGSNSQPN